MIRRTAVTTTLLAGLLTSLPVPAGAQTFSSRSGETGLLDVPDAEVSGLGGGALGAELRFDNVGNRNDLGPLPVYGVTGLGSRLDLAASMRDGGQPGDPVPARTLFGAAAKLQLLAPSGFFPGAALSLGADRFNREAVGLARLAVSTGQHPLRLAAFAGAEAKLDGFGRSGFTGGLAASVDLGPRFTLLAEAVTGPRGANYGGALRWNAAPTVGVALGANYLPGDDALRVALLLAFAPTVKPKLAATAAAKPAAEETPEAPTALAFGDRPRFKLKIHTHGLGTAGEPRHLQYGPYSPPSSVAAAPRPSAPPRVAAPSLDEVLEAQLREQTASAEGRLKRLRATEASLAEREVAVRAEVRRLQDLGDDLAAREQQLDAREKRLVVRGAPTAQQRQLESQEAQLASAERQLSAAERGYAPSLDAALGTERDAGDREQAERSEVERLSALAGMEKVRARQAELSRQAQTARQRMLSAMEARLVAKGERLEVAERQLRTRGERLDTWQRRLEARAERIELLTKRAEAGRTPEGAEPGRTTAPAPAAPTKDKAVFVMVVKSPTAIMKEPSAKSPGAGVGRDAVHPGMAVEKAVAAAAVITFTSPSAQISELDRESIDGIARLAAREGAEMLVWARAKDPSLMSEAIRRADEIKAYIVTSANLPPKQVVTRITTRPGAQGVDVVVSALREAGRAPPAPAPAVPGAPAQVRPTDKLAGGETSRRQIRDAVVAVQPSIERCVSEQMVRRGLTRAEGSLRLTVSAAGRVVGVAAGAGPLSGPELEECLRQAAVAWPFPPADTDYVVDVPITVVGGGTAR